MASSPVPDLAKLHFPGTVHYINPRHGIHDDDQILISGFGRAVRWTGTAISIYLLLVAINLITSGIHALGYQQIHEVTSHATNPILAILIGLVLTFTVQSSTVVTTITVATVGAGIVPINMAAMLIMGANLGTCFTSQLVAFGFYQNARNLHRALAAAMTHWWFNALSLLAFFFLEMLFHPLSGISGWLATRLVSGPNDGFVFTGIISALVHPVVDLIGVNGLLGMTRSPLLAASVSIVLGMLTIIGTIRWITHLMTAITAASSHLVLEHSIERSDSSAPLRSILGGLGLTMMTQSSTATICSTLPFVGTGNLSLRKSLGLVLGANLGTTLTAVLTAVAVPGMNSELALQASLIHVLFNLFGLLAVFFVRPLAHLILWLSDQTAELGTLCPLPALLVALASYTLIPISIIALATLR